MFDLDHLSDKSYNFVSNSESRYEPNKILQKLYRCPKSLVTHKKVVLPKAMCKTEVHGYFFAFVT